MCINFYRKTINWVFLINFDRKFVLLAKSKLFSVSLALKIFDMCFLLMTFLLQRYFQLLLQLNVHNYKTLIYVHFTFYILAMCKNLLWRSLYVYSLLALARFLKLNFFIKNWFYEAAILLFVMMDYLSCVYAGTMHTELELCYSLWLWISNSRQFQMHALVALKVV